MGCRALVMRCPLELAWWILQTSSLHTKAQHFGGGKASNSEMGATFQEIMPGEAIALLVMIQGGHPQRGPRPPYASPRDQPKNSQVEPNPSLAVHAFCNLLFLHVQCVDALVSCYIVNMFSCFMPWMHLSPSMHFTGGCSAQCSHALGCESVNVHKFLVFSLCISHTLAFNRFCTSYTFYAGSMF